MGFDFFKWFLGKDTKASKVDAKAVCFNLATEVYIRDLAFNMMANTVAKVFSKCELIVYEEHKKKKNDEWYRWNIQPNKNQNATEFWTKLVHELYSNNEALVVVENNELFVADEYKKHDESVFFEHYFTSVRINDVTFNKTYYMSKVFYFKLNSDDIKILTDNILSLYGKLINASYASYLVANGNKGILHIDQYAEQEEDFEKTLNEILNNDFKTFFENANAIMPLYSGYKYEQLENKGTQTTTRDFRALLDDCIDITAGAFGIPKGLTSGNVQDKSKAVDELLTFCLDPLIELLSDELNRKLFNKNQIIAGTYIKFDTKAVKHIDILDVSTAIDKLISSACFCVNDIRRICGEDEIDEEWANSYFMTKNYSSVKQLLTEGGVT